MGSDLSAAPDWAIAHARASRVRYQVLAFACALAVVTYIHRIGFAVGAILSGVPLTIGYTYHGKPEAGQDWKFPQLGPRSARRSEADLSLTRASEANAFVIGVPARSFALATIALFKIASRRSRIGNRAACHARLATSWTWRRATVHGRAAARPSDCAASVWPSLTEMIPARTISAM